MGKNVDEQIQISHNIFTELDQSMFIDIIEEKMNDFACFDGFRDSDYCIVIKPMILYFEDHLRIVEQGKTIMMTFTRFENGGWMAL